MKKDFDFDNIGKRTPYRVPEGFFDELQQHVMDKVEVKPKKHFSLPKMMTVMLAAAAVVLIGVMVLPGLVKTDEAASLADDALVMNTSWVDNMSDEDLAYMESIYECDIFMY